MLLGRRQIPWLIAGSVAIGLAGLTRPIYQLLGVALAIGMMLTPGVKTRGSNTRGPNPRGSNTIASVALVAASALLLGGLATYNQMKFDYFGVVPSLGFHLS